MKFKLLLSSFVLLLSLIGVVNTSHARELFRISLETNPTHIRNQAVSIFVEELKKKTGDYFTFKIYPSAQLYKDRDVVRAVRQGSIDMGVPVPQHLEGFVPDAALSGLPMFYGIDPSTYRKVMSGKVGNLLRNAYEEKLGVVVPGQFLDIGMQQIWTTSQEISSLKDLRGLKIRYHGGYLNSSRLQTLGAVPVLISFPDVPLALSQGAIDGMYATPHSAKLFDLGIRYGYIDNSQYYQYVPLINKEFWDKHPLHIQHSIIESWQIAVEWSHFKVDEIQKNALVSIQEKGVTIIIPSDETLLESRRLLMKTQPELVRHLKINESLVNKVLLGLKEHGIKY